MRIDWDGFATTKGRKVYAHCLSEDAVVGVNYDTGFLVGWDRWSDGNYSLCLLGVGDAA